jgi:hypothetical protein
LEPRKTRSKQQFHQCFPGFFRFPTSVGRNKRSAVTAEPVFPAQANHATGHA